jgi:hypothetical protein
MFQADLPILHASVLPLLLLGRPPTVWLLALLSSSFLAFVIHLNMP